MEYVIPYLSRTKESAFKIVTLSGDVFFAHNVLDYYRHDQRREVIKSYSKYFADLKNPSPEQDAYSVLLWELFPEYLKAYNFYWLKPNKSKNKNPKHLYILRNSLGFIKIGVANNIKTRLIDLKYEFDGEFEIIQTHKFRGNLERNIHGKLMEYIKPVYKKNGKLSVECFEDCEEVLSFVKNLSILV